VRSSPGADLAVIAPSSAPKLQYEVGNSTRTDGGYRKTIMNWADGTPPNWNDKVTALVLVCVPFFVGGIAYFFAQTIVATLRGSAPAAVTAGGLAVFFCGSAGAFCVTLVMSAERYADWSRAGITVRIHPAILWCYGIALLGAVVGSACYIMFVSLGTVELPLATPGRETVNRYLMISLLVLSLTGLVALVRRRGRAYLRIGPDGVESADILRTRSAPWDDIVDITDKGDKRARNPIVFIMKDAKPIVVPNADRFASSGAALYWMVRYYWQHPVDRDELTDGRALERLRNEQFEPN
jgi:hypothetical protein